jgi:hypothetical protein
MRRDHREYVMPRFKLLVTVACFSLLTASPALAQRMIDDAGTFPFSMGNPFASTDLPANAMTTTQSDPRRQSHAMMTRHAKQLK